MVFNFKQWKVGLKSFAIVSAVVVVFSEVPYLNHLLNQVELITLDMRYRNFNRATEPSKQVVIVDFDEDSLKKYAETFGRWPWPRRVYKELISFIAEGNPSMILFDMLFTEPQKETEDDKVLGEVSAHYKNVSHATLALPNSGLEGVNKLPLPMDRAFPNPILWRVTPNTWFNDEKYHAISLPTTNIWSSTPFIHSVNVDPDSDGILRRVPMFVHYEGQWIPSLALRGIISQSIEKRTKLYFNNGFLEISEPDNRIKHRIPLDENGNLFLHFYANNNAVTQIGAREILDSAKAKEAGKIEGITVDPEIFKGKVVIIGTSAMGINDLKVTPIASHFPGVFLHATAISNVLNNDYLREADPNTTLWFSLALVFVCYFSIFFIESFFIRNMFPPLALLSTVLASIYFFKEQSLHFPMVLPLLAAGVSLLHGCIHMAIIEIKQRRMIRGTLSKYLSPSATQHLIESGFNPADEVGKWRDISILSSDIRGFTTLSESLAPEFLVRILNEYLGEMTDIIFEHEGTLDKFIGDAVMAYWGEPVADAEHARKSVSTAIHMIRTLDAFNVRNRKDGYPHLRIGIGIHTGKAIVGNIGNSRRFDYTIIGDNVNLATRIERLTKEYGVSLLISGTTYEQVKNHFLCRPIDVVFVKGKTQAVPLYQALTERRPSTEVAQLEPLCFMFTDAFNLYQQGQFNWALESFKKIQEKYPDDAPTLTYIERCDSLIHSPPLEWQGVFAARSK